MALGQQVRDDCSVMTLQDRRGPGHANVNDDAARAAACAEAKEVAAAQL